MNKDDKLKYKFYLNDQINIYFIYNSKYYKLRLNYKFEIQFNYYVNR